MYGSRLEQLGEEFAGDLVRVVGINSNPQDSAADVKQYVDEHKLSFPLIKDRDQSLARQFGATRTPEVFVLEVIDQRRMPPWHADPQHGKFVGARRMPEDARATLAAWVAQGMPEGDAKDLPAQPKWGAGWHLPTLPDAEFAMRDRPFAVPQDGTVEYQYFVVDPKWEQDRWISAAQVIPGDASVVHHAIIFVRPPDGSAMEGIGWMGGYGFSKFDRNHDGRIERSEIEAEAARRL